MGLILFFMVLTEWTRVKGVMTKARAKNAAHEVVARQAVNEAVTNEQ